MSGLFDAIAGDLLRLAAPTAGSGRFIINDRGPTKWPYGLSGGATTINHYTTRQSARRAMQDNPLARSMVERMADTVADVGLRLELTPVIEVLGITREQADAWSRDVSARFHLWASDKRQHRSETLTFYQYQRLYAYFQQRDNDIFTRLFYERDADLQNPLQFEAIDPDQIRSDAFTTSYGLQCGVDGIERDERGREKTYKIWVRDGKGNYSEVSVQHRGYSGRLHMLHGYRPEYAGQGRGYSRLAHAIQEFENLTDFSSSVIKRAINQSSIVGFVQPSDEEDASNPFEEIMTNAGAGPAAQLFGADPQTVPGVPITPEPGQPGLDAYYRVPEATIDTPGSMFIGNLTKGSTIVFPSMSAPADSYNTFVDAFAGYLSASTGTPLEVVLMKFGQNYSASRATLLLFWRIANGWMSEMDSDLLSPVVEMWLAGEIAAGRIAAPGWSDPRLRAAWLQKNWMGSQPPDIDPVKTAKANELNIQLGATNMDRVARDLNGSSAAANLEKNRTLFADYVLPPWLVKQQAPAPDDKAQAILEHLVDLMENGG